MKSRFAELDVWRGSTVLLMVVYHLFLLQKWLRTGLLPVHAGLYQQLALVIPVSFLLLVGISIHLKYDGVNRKRFVQAVAKRSAILIISAGAITFTTILVVPQMPVYFGILHLIAVGSVLGAWLVWSGFSSWLLLGMSLMILGNGVIFAEAFRSDWWLMPLGIKPMTFATLDYFPIFPWLGVLFLGILLGRWLYPEKKPRFSFRANVPILSWLGQHALLVYMVHAPLIWVTLQLISLL